MKTLDFILICGLLPIFSCISCSQDSSNGQNFDNSVVAEVNLSQYLGTWYEIARYDHRFERNMQGVKAEYSLRDDGLIKVLNSGYIGSLSGEYKETEGKARIPDLNVPAKLEVAFFWNFWGDYYIMELADDYSYALVGSSKDKYLWILSRTPVMEQSDIDYLLQRIRERGYNANDLIWVRQKQ